jgi:predicted dehydrogenase
LLHSGSLGELLTIHATVWQGWKHATNNTWRQQPAISGGGYLFDTGAHLLNTVVDLAGQPVVEVSAYLDPRGTPVDIVGAVLGRLQSGAMITLNGCGDMFPTLGSDVRVFCTDGILRTGVWGERLQLQRPGQPSLRTVRVPKNTGPWDQFLRVRRGEIDNPCPPEVGLRMALLWDAIQSSARSNGASVTVQSPPL